MDTLGRIAQRFPLVARARPTCQPLDVRIREVRELARTAAGQTGTDRLPLAAAAHNKAALIASDCGLPDLARSLCWQQYNVYLRARPPGAQTARYALEPVVNLARLRIRGGDGDGAYQLLDTLYQTVRSRTDAVIDGTPVSFRDLTGSEEHRTLCQWLWTVLLADGTRALASAGRWDEALAHTEQHSGIGRRLLDGRQVAVVARCVAGDPASACTVLEDSAISAPWEQSVAACLTVLCLASSARPASSAIAAMVEHYLGLTPAPELLVFRGRLGLTVIDLAGGVEQPDAAQAASRLVGEAVAAGDGYAARDVLAHDGCRARLASAEEQALSASMQSSGLGRGAIPADLMADLLSAVEMSQAAAARNLAIPHSRPVPVVG
ncbi:hypothetical protein FDG2_2765 [Candidatus Protofrankia californiensis]|uniref:Uncharacterized protein n=1 Tax=Candidatus Protofrankia californiensis TaxID=1839754 RepID=A0A1C3NYB3_9ACTN|nr:hypothetical protein FDG2_2765 [Candidatus Protofrankia californiensis]